MMTNTPPPTVNRLVEQLRKDDTFDGRSAASSNSSTPTTPTATTTATIEPPGVLLWAMFFQAHWLERCGDVTAG